eukprot:1408056-Rhodomonas_salina.3
MHASILIGVHASVCARVRVRICVYLAERALCLRDHLAVPLPPPPSPPPPPGRGRRTGSEVCLGGRGRGGSARRARRAGAWRGGAGGGGAGGRGGGSAEGAAVEARGGRGFGAVGDAEWRERAGVDGRVGGLGEAEAEGGGGAVVDARGAPSSPPHPPPHPPLPRRRRLPQAPAKVSVAYRAVLRERGGKGEEGRGRHRVAEGHPERAQRAPVHLPARTPHAHLTLTHGSSITSRSAHRACHRNHA